MPSKNASKLCPYAMRAPGFAFSTCDPSGSIAVYRPQAESSGGKIDGKCGVTREEVSYFQMVIRVGDDRVGVRGLPTEFATVGSQFDPGRLNSCVSASGGRPAIKYRLDRVAKTWRCRMGWCLITLSSTRVAYSWQIAASGMRLRRPAFPGFSR